ncbi:MAG TPA: SUMF1/EgtB/PvdO family nonheme iron enzyme [Polyangiaceae bacterium]|nr:SUMF1/EgtB/PvdO family nonheme iron enzyme [Polyangiaceae bacterium]
MVRPSGCRWSALPLLALTLAVTGCPLIAGLDELPERAPIATPVHRCDRLGKRSKPGEDGALLDLILFADDTCVWMDDEEVTVGRYQEWLKTKAPDLAKTPLPPACSWKKELSRPGVAPEDACVASIPKNEVDPLNGRKPVRCVDWCDALAYCTSYGRRLCFGDSFDVTLVPREEKDEWRLACSLGDKLSFPTPGDAPGECNTGQTADGGVGCRTDQTKGAQCGPSTTGTSPSCRPRADYPVDLSGNVREWIDLCSVSDAGAPSRCQTRGGSYADTSTGSSCIALASVPRETRDAQTGFRCCAALRPEEVGLIRGQ